MLVFLDKVEEKLCEEIILTKAAPTEVCLPEVTKEQKINYITLPLFVDPTIERSYTCFLGLISMNCN